MDAYSPQTQLYVNGLQSRMMAHGASSQTAAQQAYAAIWGMVQRQAAMISFVDTFRAMAIVFLLVLPFLLIMRRPKHHRGGGGGGMH